MRAKDKIDYNEVAYENSNNCPNCNGDLRLTAKSSSYQLFVCCGCKCRFKLSLIDNRFESTGQVSQSNSKIRSPHELRRATGGSHVREV